MHPKKTTKTKTKNREEGLRRGLYKGLSLNYIKTLPNVAIYMSVYDAIKFRITDDVGQTR